MLYLEETEGKNKSPEKLQKVRTYCIHVLLYVPYWPFPPNAYTHNVAKAVQTYRIREFLVKWVGKSNWKNTWVSEVRVRKAFISIATYSMNQVYRR